jgi:hypothetical protein
MLLDNAAPNTASDDQSTTLSCADASGIRRFDLYARISQTLPMRAMYFDIQIDSSPPAWYCGAPAPALPPFWRFAAPAATCNENGLLPSADPPVNTWGVPSLWGSQPVSMDWFAGMPNETREAYFAGFAVASDVMMEAGRDYYIGQLVMPQCAGATCSGCDATVIWTMSATPSSPGHNTWTSDGPGTLVFNLAGVCASTPPFDPSLFTALRSHGKPVTSSMQALSVCDPVPAARSTWGALKLLYR